ncbi:MAG: peptide deformylase [Patescibacteria group bacterium]|jgi:peptide deformylase
MEIITIPDSRLRKKSKKINPEQIADKKFQQFILDLAKTMKVDNGVGIAAPQVGENIRVIIIDTENGPTAYINPKIIWKSFRKEIGEEGCLSVPGIWGLVKRSRSVIVTCLDKNGVKKRIRAKNLFARVFQHEIDHLNAILFTDRMTKETSKKIN